ncbi:TolC family protein [soil metagenome]
MTCAQPVLHKTRRAAGTVTALAAAVLLTACASVDIDKAIQDSGTPGFTQGKLELVRTPGQRQAREQLAASLRAQPLSMDGAVQLAIANSPAVQALLAQSGADMAAADQAGRIANPVFTFERMRLGNELELNRLLSFGLLDLLMLPQRRSLADSQLTQARVQLSVRVVDQVSVVRQAWVRAVAAKQLLTYAQQVNRSAQASAELALRMQEAGNFTKLQRARQHLFYADATAQLAVAEQAAMATREELTRQLGLSDEQAAQLKLPERLPDLPAALREAAPLSAAAREQRLDVQMARLQLDAAGKAQGMQLLGSLIDVDLGLRHDTVFNTATGARDTRRGYELDIRLPIFDWGTAQRSAMNARALAAANRYESVTRAASSQLRESYSAYRTSYGLTRHYRDEIVPLRQAMAEENVLRYNGMLVGVFELLADSRAQIASVMAAIDAQQQFWLADAGLSSALVGKPMSLASPAGGMTSSSNPEAAAH